MALISNMNNQTIKELLSFCILLPYIVISEMKFLTLILLVGAVSMTS